MARTSDKSGMFANVSMEIDGDLIFLTCAKYKLFMAHGKNGRIAKDIYEHLMFTARLQKTNTVRATESYVCGALEIGEDTFKAAKKLLIKLKLIENVVRKDEKGRIIGHYVRVKTTATPFEKAVESEEQSPEAVKTTGWENPQGGKIPPKCLNEQVEMLKRTNETLEPVGSRPDEAPVPVPVDHRESTHARLRKHFETMYQKLHPDHSSLYWDAKCGACTKKVISAADHAARATGEETDRVIGRKLVLFLQNFEEPDDFYAKQTYTPAFFLSQWNRLVPPVESTPKLYQIIRDQSIRVAQMQQEAVKETDAERNTRELLELMEV